MGKMNPAKENIFLREIIRAKEEEIAQLKADMVTIKGFTLQQALDMACIELNKEFGFGPDRNEKFAAGFHNVFVDYAEMCVADGAEDDDIWYTQEKLDGALRAAVGENLVPFMERYKAEKLYTLDSREAWRGVKMTEEENK